MAKGLCVGGPAAGQWRAEQGETFRVAVRPAEPVGVVGPHDIEEATTLEFGVYRAQRFIVEGETYTLWAPEDQSPRATFEALCSGYSHHARTPKEKG